MWKPEFLGFRIVGLKVMRDLSLRNFYNKDYLKKIYGFWRREYSKIIHDKVRNLVVTKYNAEV